MGRVKLKIKRLESTNNRAVTYSKRRTGILKKARELSILCDIDIALLMFSPAGKPTLCLGERSNIEEVIAKFAQLTPQERAKRKLESLEALKKTFKKLDHDVNIQDFLGTGTQTVEELTNQSRLLQSQLAEIHKRISYWMDPDKINSLDHIRMMEESLRESINQIRAHKENFEKQQLMSLECGQFQSSVHLPLGMGGQQQAQTLSWLPSNDGRPILLTEDPNLLPHRDIECSAGASVPSFSSYFDTATPNEIDRSGQEGGAINELNPNECLRLQLGGQFPYEPYNLNLIDEKKFKPGGDMTLHEQSMDYQVSGFGQPRPEYDANHHNWASMSGSCGVAMFEEHTYQQQPN
ncbi:agamous-like MADS-box protein AGL65 isoform X2 [Aristolochia californica]|uniref:agamous-like MADS-box protein AGL65 isoform X2 n=1 Tax=Aristolochia californica TaxID=171875 RepID=UPI0035E2A3FC